MENKTEFSTRSVKNILKSQSNKRVSDDSAVLLAQEMEEKAEEIGNKAVQYAREDGRSTVRDQDIRSAIRDLTSVNIDVERSEVRA